MARGACHENVGEKPRLNIMAPIYINLEFPTIFDEKKISDCKHIAKQGNDHAAQLRVIANGNIRAICFHI
jgi:hypothetical protein